MLELKLSVFHQFLSYNQATKWYIRVVSKITKYRIAGFFFYEVQIFVNQGLPRNFFFCWKRYSYIFKWIKHYLLRTFLQYLANVTIAEIYAESSFFRIAKNWTRNNNPLYGNKDIHKSFQETSKKEYHFIACRKLLLFRSVDVG